MKPSKKARQKAAAKAKTLKDLEPALIERCKGRCEACGRYIGYFATPASPWGLQKAHIISRTKGGSDTLDNILVLCYHCHNHDDSVTGFEMSIEEAIKIAGRE